MNAAFMNTAFMNAVFKNATRINTTPLFFLSVYVNTLRLRIIPHIVALLSIALRAPDYLSLNDELTSYDQHVLENQYDGAQPSCSAHQTKP